MKLISQYSEVHKKGLGLFTGPRTKIHEEADTVLKCCKGPPVPCAKRKKDRARTSNNYYTKKELLNGPAQFLEWATPNVPILKPQNTTHICGDYKTTLSQVSKLDNHPVPMVEDKLVVERTATTG